MLGRVFKAYDIRGTYPDLLNEQMAWQIGYGTSRFLRDQAAAAGDATPMMQHIVVGRDMRASSPSLTAHLIRGITEQGGHVIDVGMVDTPFVSFAVNHLDCAGGVMTTASHNPPHYNGFKICQRKARPVGETSGLSEIRKHAAMVDRTTFVPAHGRVESRDLWGAYTEHVLQFLDLGSRRLKVVVDASNGMAGTMVPRLLGRRGSGVAGLSLVELNFDNTRGVFAHEPNPLVAANMAPTVEAVRRERADAGVCFDGDADRLVAVDDRGRIVGCDLLTAVLARHFLRRFPGAAVVYDLRSSRVVEEEIRAGGGVAVRSRVGHVFLKEAMARHDAVFGGELSGHFYFRENFYADSGAIALCTLLSYLAQSSRPLSELLRPVSRYVQSGEVNFQCEDPEAALQRLRDAFAGRARIDELDGVTVDAFDALGWWCNVRKSNTEPLLRLNLEARDSGTLQRALDAVSPLLGARTDHPHPPPPHPAP